MNSCATKNLMMKLGRLAFFYSSQSAAGMQGHSFNYSKFSTIGYKRGKWPDHAASRVCTHRGGKRSSYYAVGGSVNYVLH